MPLPALIASLFVAVLHVGFMVLESVLWTRPAGRRIFATSAEDAEKTKVLALNQGLYNGGIAVLIAWAALTAQGPALVGLLAFIVAMGIVGAVTAKPTIFFAQSLPAIVALGLVWMG